MKIVKQNQVYRFIQKDNGKITIAIGNIVLTEKEFDTLPQAERYKHSEEILFNTIVVVAEKAIENYLTGKEQENVIQRDMERPDEK